MTDYSNYSEFEEDVRACQKCRLSSYSSDSRTIDLGRYEAPGLIIGEAPGEKEQKTELPFVGASGAALSIMLSSVGLSIEHFLVTNLVKCRPPQNRAPKKGEKNACYPFLEWQIYKSEALCIIAMGSEASKMLLGKDRFQMAKECGKWSFHEYYRRWVIPCYHPSALLYQAKMDPGQPKHKAWKALCEVRSFFINEGVKVEDLEDSSK